MEMTTSTILQGSEKVTVQENGTRAMMRREENEDHYSLLFQKKREFVPRGQDSITHAIRHKSSSNYSQIIVNSSTVQVHYFSFLCTNLANRGQITIMFCTRPHGDLNYVGTSRVQTTKKVQVQNWEHIFTQIV
jgi:hypothetical protein